jgi:pimeloyl-ACP methyl ester carboxylesterase
MVTKGPFIPAAYPGDTRFQYYIYEPAGPKPPTAPVVLFLHGYMGHYPKVYWVWMAHMVRKGHIVVWVRWDQGIVTPWDFANQAENQWRDALARLSSVSWDGVKPAEDGSGNILTAHVGHSAGGWLSAVLAARAAQPGSGMQAPRAVVAVSPGGPPLIPDGPFEDIPPSTKLVLVAGEDDTLVCINTAQTLWERTPQIPEPNKDFLLAQTDARGTPQQIANHYFPTTIAKWDTASVDARDYYITFKLSVGALNCAFRGFDCGYALGNGAPQQVDMGLWSDGVPVNPLLWVADPPTLTAACSGP